MGFSAFSSLVGCARLPRFKSTEDLWPNFALRVQKCDLQGAGAITDDGTQPRDMQEPRFHRKVDPNGF